MIGMPELAVYRSEPSHEDTAVSPTAKSTDASKLSLPIGWVAGIVVAVGGFGVSQAMARLGQRTVSADHLRTQEALALSAIRAVRAQYEVTVRAKPGWTSLSESQQRAEVA